MRHGLGDRSYVRQNVVVIMRHGLGDRSYVRQNVVVIMRHGLGDRSYVRQNVVATVGYLPRSGERSYKAVTGLVLRIANVEDAQVVRAS